MTNLKSLTEKASELGKEAKESIGDLSRSAASALTGARDETGRALHTVASSVRKGSGAIDNFAAIAADRLDSTASFLAKHDKKSRLEGLRCFGRRHQTGLLIAAIGAGFLAGSAFSRITRSA